MHVDTVTFRHDGCAAIEGRGVQRVEMARTWAEDVEEGGGTVSQLWHCECSVSAADPSACNPNGVAHYSQCCVVS